MLKNFKITLKNFFCVNALFSSSALTIALILEHFFKILPCRLCWYERYVYMAVLFLSVSACLLFKRKRAVARYATVLIAMCFFVGVCVNGYHIAVEYKWVGDELCQVTDFSYEKLLEDLKDLDDQGEVMPSCSDVSFYILGLSLAEYNMLAFVFFCILAFGMVYYLPRKRKSSNKDNIYE